MTFSRKTWIILAVLFVVFLVLPAVAYLAQRGSCLPVPEYRLVFENQMSVDVTIVNEDMNKNGEQFYQETLGTVPAGQTEKLTMVLPMPKGHSLDSLNQTRVTTIQLKAEDPAGSVVWQKSWSKDEFWDLKKEGWRIVISPETNEE
jgi:hypothetical protein